MRWHSRPPSEGFQMLSTYRLLVTGSRGLLDRGVVNDRLDTALAMTVSKGQTLIVVHGDCPTGADRFADEWGWAMQARGLAVAVEAHPAQNHPTEDFGPWPGAGPRRNRHVVSLGADECVAFLDLCTSPRCRMPQPHGSHGTMNCALEAMRMGIKTEVIELWKES